MAAHISENWLLFGGEDGLNLLGFEPPKIHLPHKTLNNHIAPVKEGQGPPGEDKRFDVL